MGMGTPPPPTKKDLRNSQKAGRVPGGHAPRKGQCGREGSAALQTRRGVILNGAQEEPGTENSLPAYEPPCRGEPIRGTRVVESIGRGASQKVWLQHKLGGR